MPATLVELLHTRAIERGDREYVFLVDGEQREARLSFADLAARASGIAAVLRDRAPASARALLLYPPGLDYICGFFGCLLAPVVAVPAYPPDPGRLERSLRRLLAIVDDARPALVLTTAAVRDAIAPLLSLAPALARLDWIASDTLPPAAPSPPDVAPDTIAVLQYTSGSTGSPRGVELDHANLIANSARIRDAFGHNSEGRGVIWLPPYHDMGLIGGILQPLYGGIDVVLMSPLDFLKRPMRWLETISRVRGTISGGPNFAYDLCVRKSTPDERAALDLSSWTLAFNGAEPIRAETLTRFAEAFAPAGFRLDSFFPCYGLAESTLIATGGPRGAPRVLHVGRDALSRGRAELGGELALVGCGRAFADGRLAIVDPATGLPCPEHAVGEIWLASPSVARGYAGRPDDTARTFGARLDGERFLRTGDLGFLHDDELYIAGRLKDLIIVRGRNHDPADLEHTVERHPSIRPGCVAAFQLAIDDPRLVIVAELAGAPDAPAIRGMVSEVHELAVHAVVLVRPGTIPKTSSGKVERYACRDAYLAGTLPAVVRDELASPLAARVASLLGATELPHDQPLTALGLDSLLAMELASELGVSAVALLEGATLADLARLEPRPAPEIAPAPAEYPLSIGQRALWFLQLVAPHSAAYNVWFAARATGLDPERWRAALQQLADRHPSLHAQVFLRSSIPWQRVEPRPIDFEQIDAVATDAELAAEAHRPFDLAAGVLRVRVYRDAILIVAHHVAIDLWSAGQLLAELLHGSAAATRPFADHVAEQPALDGPAWDYWRARLAGPRDPLPTDKPRPRRSAFRGGAVPFELADTRRLRALARREHTTPYTILLAAFTALLHRVFQLDDLWIASPTAGRPPGFERTVGYFVNPVVIRSDCSDDPTFVALIQRTRTAVLEALTHGAFPLPALAERLGAGVDRAPLFHALFALERAPAITPFMIGRLPPGSSPAAPPDPGSLAGGTARLDVLGAALAPLSIDHQAAAVDLALILFEDDHALRGSWRYDSELFTPATVERWSRQLATLLDALLDDPDLQLSDAPLDDAPPTLPAVTAEPLVLHHLIEARARERPAHPAVDAPDGTLSYAELDERASRVAAALRALGAGPERPVAVLVDRSVDGPVAFLGVLKAGAAYLPLEPTLPDARLQFLIADARAVAAVTTPALAARVALPAVLLDALPAPATYPPPPADAAAYIIYTSGSTGAPKGVVVSHRSACNLVAAQQLFGIAPADQVLQFASCAFDASIFELVLALAAGATLHVAPRLLGPALASFVRDHAITTVTFPPTVLASLPELPIATIISAGEACPRDVVARWASGRMFNAYGPTEATVWSTVAELAPSDERPPIGVPIAHVRAHVLDRRLRPCPPGAIGELYLGGPSLARGYVQPALTAERFVPDPFGPPGGRLYRTGDLARTRPDGQLDLLGRTDDQIKIRGFRVEPGELEAALRGHPVLRDAAVVAHHGTETQLVAYVAGALALDELRAFLRDRGLPDYMLPSAVVSLAAVPRLPSGKLDRRALPPPAPPPRARLAPASALESTILAVFREVLGHDQIGATDHFFEVLGGTSLTVVRACALLAEHAISIEVTTLFEHPTIRSLAAHLTSTPAPTPDHDARARARADALRRRRS